MSLSATLRAPARRDRTSSQAQHRAKRKPLNPPVQVILRAEPTAPEPDEALLDRFRDSRQPEEFDELVRRYSAELGNYLARYLGDHALAEDALQDAFLQVFTKCDHYKSGWAVRPWLYSVATHRAIDSLRRASRVPIHSGGSSRIEKELDAECKLEGVASTDPGPLEQLQERERRIELRACLNRLPEKQRQILVLAYDREMSYSDMAALLNIPVGTVKSRIHGAIARLRVMIEHIEKSGHH